MEEIQFRRNRNSFPKKWLSQYPDFAMHVLAYRRGLRNPNWMNTNMLIDTEYNIKKFIRDQREEENAQGKQEVQQEVRPLLPPRKSFCRVLSNGIKHCFGYPPNNNHEERQRTRRVKRERKKTRRVR
jgi:hypothetical protein